MRRNLYPHESSGLFVFYTKVDPKKFGQHDRYLYPQSFNPSALFVFTKKKKITLNFWFSKQHHRMLFTWTDGGYYYYLTMETKDAELHEQRLDHKF